MIRPLTLRGFAALTTDRTLLCDLPAAPNSPASVEWKPSADSAYGCAGVVDSGARIDWRPYVLSQSTLRAWCASAHTADAPVAVRIIIRSGSASVSVSLTTSGAAPRELRLPIPAAFTGEVTVALEVVGEGQARALILDPSIERSRSLTETTRAGLEALRLFGWRNVMRRLQAGSGHDDQARYRQWLFSHAIADASPAATRASVLISVITPVFNTDPVWLRQSIDSVRNQTYRHWQLVLADDGSTRPDTIAALESVTGDPRITVLRAATNRGIVSASNRALSEARGTFVGFLDHDDVLAPHALARIVERIEADAAVDVIYSDEDKIDASGARSQPHFKPEWSPELLDSCMYASHFTAIRRELIAEAGGFRDGYDGAQDYDLLLRVVERTTRISHVADVLYSWRTAPLSAASSQVAKPWAVEAGRRALEDALRRRARHGTVTPTAASGHFRVRYQIAGDPRVSVMVIARDPDARSRAAELETAVRAESSRVLDVTIAGDVADLARLALAATGDHILVLDASVRPIEKGWLDAMLELSQREEIAAVGAFLLTPSNQIAHAGLVLGAGTLASYALGGEPAWTLGHRANALDVRNCRAVSGRCLMTRREVLTALDGFDGALGSEAWAIDYALKAQRAGKRIVVTPHARLRIAVPVADADAVSGPDAARLQQRWGAGLAHDPYYNPHFDRAAATFRLPPVISRER